MNIHQFYPEIIISCISIALYFIAKKVVEKVVIRFSNNSQIKDSRALVVIRSFNILLLLLLILVIFTIWGVKAENIYILFTSVFAVIGVAMFAQWSLLSNVTAGVLLFFSFPFKIGDCIRIQDKDFPIEAHILDIKAFYTLLITKDGEHISYPNNLLLQKGIVILKKDSLDNNPML